MLAKEIMTKNVITVKKDTPIEEVIRILLENKITGVPVLDENDELVGVVSESDLIYKEESLMPLSTYWKGKEKFKERHWKAMATTAEMAMTSEVITATEDTPIEEIAVLMMENKIKRVPIVRGKKVVGIVSRADLLKALVDGAREKLKKGKNKW